MTKVTFVKLASLAAVLVGTLVAVEAQAQMAGALTENSDTVVGDAVLVVEPATIGVGEQAQLTANDLPPPSSSDMLIVVAAGAPNSVGTEYSEDVLFSSYASNLTYGPVDVGPLAPGDYEVRWLTKLYNNDNRLEVGARTPLSVDR